MRLFWEYDHGHALTWRGKVIFRFFRTRSTHDHDLTIKIIAKKRKCVIEKILDFRPKNLEVANLFQYGAFVVELFSMSLMF